MSAGNLLSEDGRFREPTGPDQIPWLRRPSQEGSVLTEAASEAANMR